MRISNIIIICCIPFLLAASSIPTYSYTDYLIIKYQIYPAYKYIDGFPPKFNVPQHWSC